jgi:hypothetical protein
VGEVQTGRPEELGPDVLLSMLELCAQNLHLHHEMLLNQHLRGFALKETNRVTSCKRR